MIVFKAHLELSLRGEHKSQIFYIQKCRIELAMYYKARATCKQPNYYNQK